MSIEIDRCKECGCMLKPDEFGYCEHCKEYLEYLAQDND